MVGTLVSDGTSLTGWKSFTEAQPNTVAGFTVWIVSIREETKVADEIKVKALKLDQGFSMKGAGCRPYVDSKADFVAAIVFYDDPTETSTQYAPYRSRSTASRNPAGEDLPGFERSTYREGPGDPGPSRLHVASSM